MKTVKSASTSARLSAVRELIPKSTDTKYNGHEPSWIRQPTDNRISAITKALTWYGYYYDRKEARDMIAAWMEHNECSKTDIKQIRTVSDNLIPTTVGFLCRMNLRGLEFVDREKTHVADGIKELLVTKQKTVSVEPTKVSTTSKPNIQERLREKMSECAGELEGMYDDFRADIRRRIITDYKPINTIRSMNIAPQMVGNIAAIWRSRQDELETVLKGQDAQLVEGYSNRGRTEIKNMIKFCETVINDCGSYVQIKKVERKPRKKKSVSPEKQAAKFKYMREFSDLKLFSEPASKLINASEAFLYNTKKRKLIHLVADGHVGQLSIKNNAVIGFDPSASVQKTLRKPGEQIKVLLSGGKPSARKIFKDIRSTEIRFNGRGTDEIIILKCW